MYRLLFSGSSDVLSQKHEIEIAGYLRYKNRQIGFGAFKSYRMRYRRNPKSLNCPQTSFLVQYVVLRILRIVVFE